MSNKRWKLTIEYNGAPYSGWQLQDNAPSIQGAIEEALFKFCGQNLRLHVAGRTDAGVHAKAQVAHFDLDYGDRVLSPADLAKAINAHLRPQPIAVLKAQEVPPEFHARFSAKNKLYLYRILNRNAPPAIDQGFVWLQHRPLDVPAMHDAAQVLVGVHDFTSFRATECQAKSPVKSVDRFDVIKHGDEIHFEVEGRSFLHHQVRNMVGSLMLVGKGKWTRDNIQNALDAKDRSAGGMTAPPDGLSLERIDYDA